MNTNLKDIKKKALPVLIEEGVVRSSIFGSYVRGDNKEDSDIDMLVELPKGKSYLDLVSLQRKLGKVLVKKVDLLTYNSISPLLKDYIQRDQVQIL